jgi:hypothetical protein
MMKLLQTSALTALTLLFAACDPGMIDGDLEDRELQGDLYFADAEDGELELDIEDFADAPVEPAPAVGDYDLDIAAADDGGCDSSGDDDDDGVFADGPNHQGAFDDDDDRDFADVPDEDEPGWGPEDIAAGDDGDEPDVWTRPLGDKPDEDGDDGWGPEDLNDADGDDSDAEPAIDYDDTIRDHEDEGDDDDIDDIATP